MIAIFDRFTPVERMVWDVQILKRRLIVMALCRLLASPGALLAAR
jgi:hypothetical protein